MPHPLTNASKLAKKDRKLLKKNMKRQDKSTLKTHSVVEVEKGGQAVVAITRLPSDRAIEQYKVGPRA